MVNNLSVLSAEGCTIFDQTKVLFPDGEGDHGIVAALEEQSAKTIVQNPELAFNPAVIAREAIEMRDAGVGSEWIITALAGSLIFETVQAKEPQMLDGHMIDQQFFRKGNGMVFFVHRLPEFIEDLPFIFGKLGKEQLIRGAQTMLECIAAGGRIEVIGLSHSIDGNGE
jgi:hypothetical protein